MKVIVTSTYENVDKEWLDWWLKRLAAAEVMPGSMSIVSELIKNGSAKFISRDPTSDVVATTKYEVIR